ncbi:MAG: citrate/2-methylcitrate synthase [Phycisphaerae bacterium]|jgi:2-methylcitrate synthase/citrate synthase II
MNKANEAYHPGLEGVIAGETAICSVEQDGLAYRGYDVTDLAEHASFEECAYLLLHGELPTEPELKLFRRCLASHYELPPPVIEALRAIPRHIEGMDVLRTGVSLSAHYDSCSGSSREVLLCRAARLLAQTPAIIGARLRLLAGQAPLAPLPGLSHAGQMLYLTLGHEPTPLAERTLNLTLILYAEHEFNASTFAARVCTSTESDLYSAVVAAIATLKGPLHGGANEAAIRLINRFGSAAEARTWVTQALADKTKIMGFGHRVYKNGDHRARILERHLGELAAARDERWRLEVYDAIKDTVQQAKGLHPNLDFPCGLAYYLLGLPIDIYTPLFVASRVSGWCAHIIEQTEHNRIIRPRSRYTGPPRRKFVPLAER